MKLLKLADRTVSVLGLILFGVLTGFSLFLTSYFALTYEEIPHTKGDIFPLVLLICGLLTFLMYRFSGWMLKKEEGQERRIRILAGAGVPVRPGFRYLVGGRGQVPAPG